MSGRSASAVAKASDALACSDRLAYSCAKVM